jgi:hypothetical protein
VPAIGDEVTARVGRWADRNTEYAHTRDHRGSGTESVDVPSRYKGQDGLGYYESTRGTARHFFAPSEGGEYATRERHKGRYPPGLALVSRVCAPASSIATPETSTWK